MTEPTSVVRVSPLDQRCYQFGTARARWAGLPRQSPARGISQVRAAEDSGRDHTRWPRGKTSDDATIVYWHPD